ncbi:MAG TPA: alpha/beta fold hydrolase, partial [Gemmatimonadaceae bacterium]|nr:alpha/beta fold hydrolase [Gemmatimonadaceae bacterium]
LVEAAAAGRPVVLVTHSLGAAVAYRHLRDRAGPDIRRWVTLGAPLGDPDLRALLLGDATATLRVPKRVQSWINVVREGDPFASALAPLLPKDGGRVTDIVRREVRGDPHDLAAYLKDDETARSILWAWCDAFGKTKPEGCRGIEER